MLRVEISLAVKCVIAATVYYMTIVVNYPNYQQEDTRQESRETCPYLKHTLREYLYIRYTRCNDIQEFISPIFFCPHSN